MILNAVSLSILAEMSSCPLALVVSSVESRLYTSSSVQRKFVGQLSGEVCGRSLSVSTGEEWLKFFTKEALRRFAFSRLEVAMMSPLVNVGMMLCLLLRDFTTFQILFDYGDASSQKFTFCLSQVCHNLVLEFLEHETITFASITMGFLKI